MNSPHVEACHAVKLRTVALSVPPSQAVAKFPEIADSREKAVLALRTLQLWGIYGIYGIYRIDIYINIYIYIYYTHMYICICIYIDI